MAPSQAHGAEVTPIHSGADVAGHLRRAMAEEGAGRLDVGASDPRRNGSRPAPATGGRRPLRLDPAAIPEPPDYLAEGRIERKAATVVTGDTGSGKSFTATHSLAVAVAEQRGEWLGRPLRPGRGRVLVVDEENPERLVRARLRALGLSAEGAERLRYFNRAGVQLGDGGEGDGWLRAELQREGADLLVIDTATSAIDVDHNDNRAVTAVYRDLLRPLADEFNLAVVLLLHERKTSPQGQKGPQTMATLGARSWIGQADVQLMLARAGEASEDTGPDGTIALETRLALRTGKLRDGGVARPQTVRIASKLRGDRALLSAEVVIDEAAEVPPPTTVEQVEELLRAEPGMTIDALQAATRKAEKTIREALKQLGADGPGKPKRYSLPEEALL